MLGRCDSAEVPADIDVHRILIRPHPEAVPYQIEQLVEVFAVERHRSLLTRG
jgi:hypothetical protein